MRAMMSHRFWFGARNNLSRAIDNHNIEQTAGTRQRFRRRLPRILSDERADIDATRLAIGENLIRCIGVFHTLNKIHVTACVTHALGKIIQIDFATPRMQIKQALSELRHFRKAAPHRDLLHGMRFQIFQHAACEIAHINQRHIGQRMKFLDRFFGRVAGRACNMRDAFRARDINAAMNGSDPRRAGEGNNNTGCSQNRQATNNSQTRIECLRGVDRFHSSRH